MSLRVTPHFHILLKNEADAEHRSLQSYLMDLITQARKLRKEKTRL